MPIDFDFDITDGAVGVNFEGEGNARLGINAGFAPRDNVSGLNIVGITKEGFGVKAGLDVDGLFKGNVGATLGLFLPNQSGGTSYYSGNPFEAAFGQFAGGEAASPRGLYSTAELPIQSKYGEDSWTPTGEGGRRYPDGTIFYPDGRRIQEGDRPNQNEIPVEPEQTPDRPGLPQDTDKQYQPTQEQPTEPQPFKPDPSDPFRPTDPESEDSPNKTKVRLRRVR